MSRGWGTLPRRGRGIVEVMRVGLIGCGFMGQMHANVYRALDGVELVAVTDRRPEKRDAFAKQWGVQAMDDFEALLDRDDLDIIDICLPTYLHADTTVRALDAGKHVLCEKPMAMSVEDADRMIDARDRSGKRLMIAHCIRFWPEYAKLKEIVDSGALGKLLSLNLTRYGAFPKWASDGWNADENKAGGGAMDMHIHDTDYALYLLGMPDDMVSFGTYNETGVGHIFTTMTFGDTVVHLEGGWNLPSGAPFKMAFRAVFEKGVVIMDGGPMTVFEEGKDPIVPEFPKMSAEGAGGNLSDLGGYYYEIADFCEAIRHDRPLTIAPAESSRASLEVNLAEIRQVKERLGLI